MQCFCFEPYKMINIIMTPATFLNEFFIVYFLLLFQLIIISDWPPMDKIKLFLINSLFLVK